MHRVDDYEMVRRRTAHAGLKGSSTAMCSAWPASPLTSRREARSKTHRPWRLTKARARRDHARWGGADYDL